MWGEKDPFSCEKAMCTVALAAEILNQPEATPGVKPPEANVGSVLPLSTYVHVAMT